MKSRVNGRGSDVRELSHDVAYEQPHGQSEAQIAFEALAERGGRRYAHSPKPARWYLLKHLGLNRHAEALLN